MDAAISVAVLVAGVDPASVVVYLKTEKDASTSLMERIIKTDKRLALPMRRVTHYRLTTIRSASR